MLKRTHSALLVSCTVAVVALTPGSFATDTPAFGNKSVVDQDSSVMDRTRPEYDAKGIPLAGFRLFPTLAVTGTYDDNVFRLPEKSADTYTAFTPTLYLKSDWGRHFVEIYAGSESFLYTQYTKENLTDFKVGGDGRYDISRAAIASINSYYSENHEPLSSPNTVGYQAKPNRYFQTHADVTSAYQPNRLGFGLGVSFDRYDWQTTPRVGGGVLSNADRNQNNYQAYAKTFYDFSPGYSGFVKASYDERDYDDFYDRSGLHRSSHGFHVDSGLDFQVTHLVSGEVFIGYIQQNFSQHVTTPLSNISGLDYGAELDWYATPLVTIHLSGKRTLDDVTITGASVADNKSAKLTADYEVLRNVIAHANISFMETRFVGTSRLYSYPSGGGGLSYLVNSYASLNFDYLYSKRSANVSGAGFSDNTINLNLKLHV